jgi:2'-5' RNA ligase/GNAT superfamily N-acetyltransferase
VATRRRLGVALLPDPPVSDAVDGLRRAVGDPALGRVPPHITLVPPVNVRAEEVGAALARLRTAAASQPGLLRLTLGPPGTFLPVNPVLYLEVGGDLDRLRALRDAVFDAPLRRPLSWPWVPHLTLADSATEERIAASLTALDRFAMVAAIDRVVLLEETRGRLWSALADAALGPATVVGRGGLALHLTRGRICDPEVRQMIDEGCAASGGPLAESWARSRPDFFPIVLSARREGRVAGAALAWRGDDGGHAVVFVAPGVRRQGIGGTLLAHLESAVATAGWTCPSLHAHGPAGFYRARSSYSKATEA